MSEQVLCSEQNRSLILELKTSYPKHYIKMIKTRNFKLWLKIQEFNKDIECSYEITNAQKVYNYLNNIKIIPLCPATSKQLNFLNTKFEYRKFCGRGIFTTEFTRDRGSKRTGTKYNKNIIDYKTLKTELTSFKSIYLEYKKVLSTSTFNAASQLLSTKYPKLKNEIHNYFNYYEPFRACLYCIINNIEAIPVCEIDKVSLCTFLGEKKGFTKTANINAHILKSINVKNKIDTANVINKDELIVSLRSKILELKSYQNLKQSLLKIDPDIVASVIHYTSQLKNIKKFSERCYILLNGVPQKSRDKIKLHYQSFNEGYYERFKHTNESVGENEIFNFINSELNIPCEKMRDAFEIDIFIPSKSIGIEYNGEYFHSNIHKDKMYHYIKTQHFLSRGINILHIFETEWYNKKDIVKSIICSKLGIHKIKIYARKCRLVDMTSSNKNEFLKNNHIQGIDKSFDCAGLEYNGEIVSIMTLCKRKITGRKTIEMSRFCSALNTQVVGGASKLLKYLLKRNKDIQNITTYCDVRYGANSNVYETLGFTFKHISSPDYYYFKPAMPKYCKLLHRSNFMKHKLVSKLEVFDSLKTEKENMDSNKYLHIYDCGNKVYEMVNPYYKKQES
jgi:hypothetical protein